MNDINLFDHSTKFESFRISESLAYCDNVSEFSFSDKMNMFSFICFVTCDCIPFSQILGSCLVLST